MYIIILLLSVPTNLCFVFNLYQRVDFIGKSQIYQTVSNDSCHANATDCTINCNGCRDLTIDCGTTTDCNSCVINCSGDNGCDGTTFNTYHCANVIVNCNDTTFGVDVGKTAIINAPDSGGNLTVNALLGDCFENTEIYSANGSGLIEINCYSTADRSCKDMYAYGNLSSQLEFNCYENAECKRATIYCPDNDYTINGEWGTPCM